MCGIAGIFGENNLSQIEAYISEMTNALEHRGPDSHGFWTDEKRTLALGHRRLSIIDLSETGHQPMVSACGRFVITFNGEIYNHLELRAHFEKLSRENHGEDILWKGTSDTETILEGFSLIGINETLKMSVGMFAMAIWDLKEERLHLTRDRMGEKPLYYGWSSKNFIFASELKALRKYGLFNNEIDRDSLNIYMRHNYIPTPRSIYKSIYKLEPGTKISLSLNDTESNYSNLEKKVWWSLKEATLEGKKNLVLDEQQNLKQLENCLLDSIKLQSVADVPLGAFLSGGVDSSLIVALMQSNSKTKINTFSIGFKEGDYNEAEYAKEVANHLNTNHTEYYLSFQDALDLVPRLPELYDEPFADSSQIPTHLVSLIARKHVTVVLSGDAGDELFGGYVRHLQAPRVWKVISFIPKLLRPMISYLLLLISANILNKLGNHLPKNFRINFLGDKLHRFADRLSRLKDEDDLYYSLVSEWENPSEVVLNSKEPENFLKNKSSWPKELSFEERMMYLDMSTYLPDDILVKVDRASMATSLEARVPFLDHRVVELSQRIPLKQKIYEGEGKRILRKILYKYVPKELIERPKQGFGIPLGEWLRGPLKEWAEGLLSEERLEREGFFDAHMVQSRWKEHLSKRRNWEHSLWSILMFQAWLDSN
tara:strand:- start:3529 stop:5490 length:1962 start_codon:yes stop_codon:yes gene_type:complete